MSDYAATIEQVALYLGAPWKINRLDEPCDWRFEIIDGSGHGLFILVSHQKKQFRISGQFPRTKTRAYDNNYKTIGVGLTRPPKDIAADISRRLLPHYLDAFETAKARFAEEQAREQSIDLIACTLVKVTKGSVAQHSGYDQRTVYFSGGEAQIYACSQEVKLTLNSLSAEQAIKIAAMVCAPVEPTKYEVQQNMLCDGWVNTWCICEDGEVQTMQVFDTEEEAQAELDEFFREIEEEIAYGERDEDDGYNREEFRIVPVKGGA